jgi:hypothetical protein
MIVLDEKFLIKTRPSSGRYRPIAWPPNPARVLGSTHTKQHRRPDQMRDTWDLRWSSPQTLARPPTNPSIHHLFFLLRLRLPHVTLVHAASDRCTFCIRCIANLSLAVLWSGFLNYICPGGCMENMHVEAINGGYAGRGHAPSRSGWDAWLERRTCMHGRDGFSVTHVHSTLDFDF